MCYVSPVWSTGRFYGNPDGWVGGGEGVFELGNPEGRGAQAVLEIQVDGRGQKTVPSVMGVWIFSGITHGMITCMYGLIIYIQCTMIAKPIKVQDLCYSISN